MQASVNLHLQYAHAWQLSGRQAASLALWLAWSPIMQRYMCLPCPVIHHGRKSVCVERSLCLTSWKGKQLFL